jgi:serine protease Do
VARAQEDGPAAKAGIRNGDVILRFNNQEVREMRALPRIVAETPVGREVPVVVWRDGKEQTLAATVGELPSDPQQAAATPGAQQQRPMELAGLGLRVASISPEIRERFGLKAEQRGVVIVEVAPGSPAAERELRPGDVIAEVQQERVNTPQELQARLEQLRRQNRPTALLLIESQQGQRFVPLRLRGGSGERGSPG